MHKIEHDVRVLDDAKTDSMQRMPVLFTCPHNGQKTHGLDIRENGSNLPPICVDERFRIIGDTHTRDITEGITNKITSMYGKKPYTKIANVKRTRIDFNRREECAFKDPRAKQYYDEYHKYGILQIVEEMHTQNNNGLCFLFDIHGTKKTKYKGLPLEVLIGTDEDRSIHALTELDPNVWESAYGIILLLRYTCIWY